MLNLTTIPVKTLAGRYGLAKQTISDRLKGLGIEGQRIGREKVISIQELHFLDELDRYLKENPSSSIKNFLSASDRTITGQSDNHRTVSSPSPETKSPQVFELSGCYEQSTGRTDTGQLLALQELGEAWEIIERYEKLVAALKKILDQSKEQSYGWRENYYLLLEQYEKALADLEAEKEVRAERWCLECQPQ